MKQTYEYLGDDAEFNHSGKYTITCNCGKTHTVFTQLDDRPEYRTTVKIVCDCARQVVFELPVN